MHLINLRHARAICTVNDQWTWQYDGSGIVEPMRVIRGSLGVFWAMEIVGPIRWNGFEEDNRL